jgi:hypothetical protein
MKFNTTLLITCILIGSLDVEAKTYKGAELRTVSAMQYGKFEVRMRSASAGGMLSSFFTYYDGSGLPANWNEIDIEILGRYDDQVQFNTITANETHHVQSVEVPFNPHDAFHVYAIEWTPDYVAWTTDGYEVYRQYGTHIQELIRSQKLMMNIWQPVYVDWVGSFEESDLPLYAFYDWVKYYTYNPESEQHFTLAWQDDFTTWNVSRWAKATHTWEGNNCDFITDNCVFNDGYMILCLTDAVNTGYDNSPVVDQDASPPALVWGRAFTDRVTLFFSEALDPATASDSSHYTVVGSTVHHVELQDDSRTVILVCDPLQPGESYNIIVTGMKDTNGNQAGVQFKILTNSLVLPATINCGGSLLSAAVADQVWDYSKEYGRTAGTAVTNGTVVVSGTNEPELYTTALRNPTFYSVRLTNGTYRVILKFAETEYQSAGQRVFGVFAEGDEVIPNLDIFAQAGSNAALEVELTQIEVDDGILDLYFKDISGVPVISGITIEKTTSGGMQGDLQSLPQDFTLQVYPNPFNLDTNLRIFLPKSAHISLELFDISGQRVKQILKTALPAGEYLTVFSAQGLSTGIYFLQLVTDNHHAKVDKLILIK